MVVLPAEPKREDVPAVVAGAAAGAAVAVAGLPNRLVLELLVVVEAPAPKLKPDVVAGLAVVAAEAPKPPKPVLAAGAVVLEDKPNGELVVPAAD